MPPSEHATKRRRVRGGDGGATLARLKPSVPRVPRERAAKRARCRLATLAIARKKTRHRRGRHRRRQRVAPDVLRLGRKRVARDERPSTRRPTPTIPSRSRRGLVLRGDQIFGGEVVRVPPGAARRRRRGGDERGRARDGAVKRERRRRSPRTRRVDEDAPRRRLEPTPRTAPPVPVPPNPNARSRRRSSRPPLARLAYPYLPVPLSSRLLRRRVRRVRRSSGV